MKRVVDLMHMLGLNEATEYLAEANTVHCYGFVLRMEDGQWSWLALVRLPLVSGESGLPHFFSISWDLTHWPLPFIAISSEC